MTLALLLLGYAVAFVLGFLVAALLVKGRE
jgi:hypothetical protein